MYLIQMWEGNVLLKNMRLTGFFPLRRNNYLCANTTTIYILIF